MKLMNALAGAILSAAVLAAPLGALAQPLVYPAPGYYDSANVAYTAKTVSLRAGPDRYYPVIAVLAPATQVLVQGCLPDYRWCDVVVAGYDRGWVYAGNLRYPYQYGYLSFPRIAPYISIAILQFVFHDYWYLHYRDRPWYADRDRYVRPPPPPRPPAPPPWVQPPPPPPRVVPPNPRPWVQLPAQPPRVQPPRVQPPPQQPPRVQPPPPQPPRVQPPPPPPQPPRVQPQQRGQVQPNPREETRRQDAREDEGRRGRPGSDEERTPGR